MNIAVDSVGCEMERIPLEHLSDIYYLRDAMDGHKRKIEMQSSKIEHDGGQLEWRRWASVLHSIFDIRHSAFGCGSFAWRGAEGSVYDASPTLVYMQARHYDPTIGRFIEPDSLPMASGTTQGMNRYNYCENDPVNQSDPTGRFAPAVIVIGLLVAIAFGIGTYFGYTGPVRGGIWSDLGAIVGTTVAGYVLDYFVEDLLGGFFISPSIPFLLIVGALVVAGGLLGYLFGLLEAFIQRCGLSIVDAIANYFYPGIAFNSVYDGDDPRLVDDTDQLIVDPFSQRRLMKCARAC